MLKMVSKSKVKTRKREREEKKNQTAIQKKKKIKKMTIRTYLSIITLTVNGLNDPTKRHRLAERIQKQDPHVFSLQETYFRSGKHEDLN